MHHKIYISTDLYFCVWLTISLNCDIISISEMSPWSHKVWAGFWFCQMQSSAIIMRSNIVRYYINNYRNWGRISTRCWIHIWNPIPRPLGRGMGCLTPQVIKIQCSTTQETHLWFVGFKDKRENHVTSTKFHAPCDSSLQRIMGEPNPHPYPWHFSTLYF